jgi:hypothetical protein
MIFGADVTHPTSFNPADPSIAAVTASYDNTLGRFTSRVIKQVGDRGGRACVEEEPRGLRWQCAACF